MQTVGGYTIKVGRARMCPLCGGAELRYTGETKPINEKEHYKHKCIRCGLEFWFDGKYGE